MAGTLELRLGLQLGPGLDWAFFRSGRGVGGLAGLGFGVGLRLGLKLGLGFKFALGLRLGLGLGLGLIRGV